MLVALRSQLIDPRGISLYYSQGSSDEWMKKQGSPKSFFLVVSSDSLTHNPYSVANELNERER